MVNVLAQFTSKPLMSHWSLIKHLMRYLCSSKSIGIHIVSSTNKNLYAWAGTNNRSLLLTCKSISGYVIFFCGNPILWTTKKQPIVAQSTTEAKFVAINKCTKQLLWMSNLLVSLKIHIEIIPIIFNNNSGAVVISKEAQLNPNTKHIEICFQCI
jgi:hypothetical protein